MRRRTHETVRAAVWTALLCLLSRLAVPMPSGVPVTLQVFAVALLGCCQDGKHAMFTVFGYLLLGLIGVPVFASAQSGVGALIGPTGGFLIGFLPLAALSSRYGGARRSAWWPFLGLFCCYAVGTAWFSLIAHTPMWSAFLLVGAPYLAKDAALTLAALLLSAPIRRASLRTM